MRAFRILLAATALAVSAPASAELNLNRAEVAHLPNGLTVILLEDRSFPVVSVQMLYKSGSAAETAGKTGLAHFLEHLVFRGSENFPRAAATEFVYDSGGEWHGYTALDQTAYFETVPKDGLEQLLRIHADRMAQAIIDPASIEAEKGAVITELHSYENDPEVGLAGSGHGDCDSSASLPQPDGGLCQRRPATDRGGRARLLRQPLRARERGARDRRRHRSRASQESGLESVRVRLREARRQAKLHRRAGAERRAADASARAGRPAIFRHRLSFACRVQCRPPGLPGPSADPLRRFRGEPASKRLGKHRRNRGLAPVRSDGRHRDFAVADAGSVSLHRERLDWRQSGRKGARRGCRKADRHASRTTAFRRIVSRLRSARLLARWSTMSKRPRMPRTNSHSSKDLAHSICWSSFRGAWRPSRHPMFNALLGPTLRRKSARSRGWLAGNQRLRRSASAILVLLRIAPVHRRSPGRQASRSSVASPAALRRSFNQAHCPTA